MVNYSSIINLLIMPNKRIVLIRKLLGFVKNFKSGHFRNMQGACWVLGHFENTPNSGFLSRLRFEISHFFASAVMSPVAETVNQRYRSQEARQLAETYGRFGAETSRRNPKKQHTDSIIPKWIDFLVLDYAQRFLVGTMCLFAIVGGLFVPN